MRARQLQTESISGEDPLAFEQLYYGMASRLEPDGQGRVVLPERQLALVDIGDEITLAGASTRIDIWKTAEYREFVQTSFENRWPDLQRFMRKTLEQQAHRQAGEP